MTPLNKITVVGVGLIGGSFAKGIKQAKLAKQVVGLGKNEANLDKAVALDVIDSYTLDAAVAMKDCDLVLLAVPLGAMESVLLEIKPYLSEKTIITDAGSAKASVILSALNVFGQLPVNFVPGHPIAGKEKSGVEAADEALYINHRVILTPPETTSLESVAIVEGLWKQLGANVESMSAQQHDEIFAATSHLPHVLAFALVDMLNNSPELGNVFSYTAGGFRDFTRIASSDATMWRDIALTNSDAIAKWLKQYQQTLTEITRLVESHDGDALFTLFANAKAARDKHINN